jgi:hypothetical protein
VKIKEISVEPKYHKRQIITVDVNQESQQEASSSIYHDIFKVEINNGKIYALDLAGAQFGRYDPVTSWEDYLNTRVEKITEREHWEQYRYFGGLKAYHKKEADDLSSLDKFQFSQFAGVNMCASERLEEVTLAWMEAKKLRGFKAMLGLPQEEFQAMKKELLKMIKEEMEAFVVRTKENLGPLKDLRNARGCALQ